MFAFCFEIPINTLGDANVYWGFFQLYSLSYAM